MRLVAVLACASFCAVIAPACGGESDAGGKSDAAAAEATFREFQTLAIRGQAEACSRLTADAKQMVADNFSSDSCEAAITATVQALGFSEQAKALARFQKTKFDVEVDDDTATITVADVPDDEGATLIK